MWNLDLLSAFFPWAGGYSRMQPRAESEASRTDAFGSRPSVGAVGIAGPAFMVCAWALFAIPAAAEPPMPPASATPSEDGTWSMPSKNYANTRYSGLDEITRKNVKSLQVSFTFSPGVNRGQESAPIVVGDTLYLVTPFPNILYALDLSRPGRADEMAVSPGTGRERAGRGMLRYRQPRADFREWTDLLQHPR
jgi:hypothetical protein